jgi:hypothetical protein
MSKALPAVLPCWVKAVYSWPGEEKSELIIIDSPLITPVPDPILTLPQRTSVLSRAILSRCSILAMATGGPASLTVIR